MDTILKNIFPICHGLIDPETWSDLEHALEQDFAPERFPDTLSERSETGDLPAFLPDLARIEAGMKRATERSEENAGQTDNLRVNPTLMILQVSWKHLDSFFAPHASMPGPTPAPGEEMLILWRDMKTGKVLVEKASDEDLLVLKIVIEDLDPVDISQNGPIRVGTLDRALDHAVARGLLLRPPSRIRRPPSHFRTNRELEKDFASTPVFTLQWHITQACELHCKHCYDRSDRSPLTFDQAESILDDFRTFCRSHYVDGQITFTGGNPLLYPRFDDLYRAAADRGLATGILGNPTSGNRLKSLIDIQVPVFFQVSLEGLREQNDDIRGAGHFDRSMAFLQTLKDLNIYSMVMLTLTSENIRDVLPLAELLRDKADSFTFNRLSLVGEGAGLCLPSVGEYEAFLKEYLEAGRENPILGLKDNLINILLHREGKPLKGGCTGFGCGAAFNFLTLLADGEVHACRKFPSYIGSIFENDFAVLYASETARRYRAGTKACSSCSIRPVCGGCLASTYSHGLDLFEDRDPFCFLAGQK